MQSLKQAVWLVLVSIGLCLAVPSGALAQGTDVVELVGGGFIRGTILEHIPGDHVTIQLANGEVRTVSAGEIVRVGIDTPRPVPAAASAEPARDAAPGAAHVEVTTDLPGLTLHRITGTATLRDTRLRADAHELVCVLPCQFTVPSGTYYLAYGRGGDFHRFPAPAVLTDGARLHVRYEQHDEEHLIGALVVTGGLVVGAAILIPGLIELTIATSPDAGGVDEGLGLAGVIVGGVIMLTGLFVGAAIAGRQNRIHLTHAGAVTF
jgi:hypothetical protein